MKKNTLIKDEKSAYTISVLIDNIALLRSIDCKICLYNIKTHEQISEFAKYYINYFSKEKFYFVKLPTSTDKENYYDVYDVEQEKYLLKNLLHVDGEFAFSIFKDSKNNKYHLFDMNLVRTNKNVLIEEFDDVKLLASSYFGKYAVVTRDGKKGVYKSGEGFVVPFIYDDIRMLEKHNDICILEDGGKKQFAFHLYSEGFIVSKEFKDIWIDSKDSQILYCNDGAYIYIYDLDTYGNRLMCKIPLVDEIKCSHIYDNRRYMFIVKKNNKYGIYGFNASNENSKEFIDSDGMHFFNSDKPYFTEYKTASYLELVPIIYEGIENKDNDYTLYSDLSGNNIGKKSYYGYRTYTRKDYYKSDAGDDLLVIDSIFLLFNGDECDIYTYDRFSDAYIQKCKYIDHIDENVIYEKYGRKGIFMYDEKYPFIYGNLDNIEDRGSFNGSNIFVVTKHEKQGILFGKSELMKPDNIKILQIYNPDKYYSKILYIVIAKNKKKIINYLTKKGYRSEVELNTISKEYSRVEFYKDFYLVDDNNGVVLFDYDNKKITTFANGTIIEQLELEREKGTIIVYKIEDKYYFYSNGEFEEALEENINRYYATYEVNSSIYEINTIIKEEYEHFCNTMDSMSDEEAALLFEKYLNDKYTLRNKYKNLSLVKKN